ncbi:AbrB/MazE/SpoVT family DNA-binding domain-containing protein [Candidatus Poribacteria bacterium]|nr:AbrB/MazE/SpoVT family DNA-binding domain-containing protein [Candidatus Poribacteria bacterium]
MSQIKVRKNFIIAIPKDLQNETSIKEGDIVEVKVDELGRIIISNADKSGEYVCPVLASKGIWQDEIDGVDYVNQIRKEWKSREESLKL